MELSKEQIQTQFLAIILPALTLLTHLLLSLSFTLPGADRTWAVWSLTYNGLAAFASVLGLVGAVRLSPRLVSAYTGVHATTLAFVTLALINFLLQFDLRYMNPVIASWRIDEQAICRDIDAEFGWDEEWIMQCLKSLGMVQIGAACGGLVLVIAQWWALITVRSWSIDLQDQRMNRGDLEKADFEVEEYDRFEKQAY